MIAAVIAGNVVQTNQAETIRRRPTDERCVSKAVVAYAGQSA
jgi:hypothetical protein